MTLPRGFVASGVRAGIRKKRPDLALFVAPRGAAAAALFTKNRFQAAPVLLSKTALAKSSGRARAVVINAGCANAVTGAPGLQAARRVRARAAAILSCPPEEILLASTGVIGVPLPDAKVRAALPGAFLRLSPSGVEAASHAILTTDVGPKVAQATFRRGGRRGRIVGIAKGAGMIHPDMATMLVVLMTDAAASPAFLKRALREAADRTFHVISVDGDTSTNDTVFLLASGAMGGPPLRTAADGGGSDGFRRALYDVCHALALMIVRDGEGATRLMEVRVSGGRTAREARLAAHAVATSPLVKTALSSGDPNWGRILGAVGRSGARFSPRRVSLRVGDLALVRDGVPQTYRERDAAQRFSSERVVLSLGLGAGRATASKITCDLGHDYIAMNADYRT
jgi:glutamate N-acetyltransferase/amino-acid N-acetyltransferase